MGKEVRVRVSSLTIQKFLDIQDSELQKFIFVNGATPMETHMREVDDDEKIGYFQIDYIIKCNLQGVFYRSSKVRQWIVYDKVTKKVRISSLNNEVFRIFLEKYFDKPGLVTKLVTRPTATFCKKVVENKIKTIRDIIKYIKSYSLRNTKLDDVGVLRCIMAGNYDLLRIIEDPENLTSVDQINTSSIPPEVYRVNIRKFKAGEIDKIKDFYGRWVEEQNKKYVTLFGQGTAGYVNLTGSEFEF